MKDTEKSKEQLIIELNELRQKVSNKEKHSDSDQNLISFINQSLDGIVLLNEQGIIIKWNNGMEQITGFEKNEVYGHFLWDFIYKVLPCERKSLQAYNNIKAQVLSFIKAEKAPELERLKEFKIQCSDGSIKFIQQLPFKIQTEKACLICCTIRDISERRKLEDELMEYRNHLERIISKRTSQLKVVNHKLKREAAERKRAVKALQAEQQRLFSLLDSLPAFVYLQTRDYTVRFSNKFFMNHFGDANGECCYEILHYRKEPCEGCCVFNIFETKIPQVTAKRYPNGRIYEVYGYPFKDVDGTDLVLVLGIDITEHKNTEELLRLSEEHFAKAFDANPNPMTISTIEDGRFIKVNKSFLNMNRRSVREIIGRSAMELGILTLDDHTNIVKNLYKEGSIRNLEIEYRTVQGEARIGLFSAEIVNLDKPYILNVINDITELRALEQEMAQLERLNLIGEMAAGIGHEVRNPMTTVRGFLQIFMGREKFAKEKEYLKIMIDELDRANSIITEFLSLAKNKAVDLQEQNLNTIIKSLFPLIQADAFVAEKYIMTELGDIRDLLLNKKEIHQLIFNLVHNGLEAMSSGGTLTIKTFMDGDEVVLSVKDQGEGIKPEVLKKLGTPFFTTKPAGTGLGLATSYSIANRHNAYINVDTGSGGTTFYVRFK